MARLIVLGLLNVIEMGMPLTYHALLAIAYLSNRNALLLELHEARKALDDLRKELEQFSSLDGEAVRQKYRDGLELEILACRSQIRRLRKESNRLSEAIPCDCLLRECLQLTIAADQQDLVHLESLARELKCLDSAELHQSYLKSLHSRIASQELICEQIRTLLDSSLDSEDESEDRTNPYLNFGYERCA